MRIADYADYRAFLTKLLVLLAAGANALLLRILARPGSRTIADLVGRPPGRIAASASVALWIAAVVAGRWIAFA